MDEKSINSEIQPVSAKLVIVQGVVQNLPEIVGAIKEIYTLNKKDQIFGKVSFGDRLQSKTSSPCFKITPELFLNFFIDIYKYEGKNK